MQKQCAMPHQTCKSQLNVFSTLIFHHAVAFLLLTHSHGGQAQTMLATVGDDVTLPCHVRPATDAVNQMLEWSRPDLNPRFVHVRRSGEVRLVDQNPSYKGRTSVSIVGLKQGDASLTLSKVRVTDEGTYRCFVPGLKTESNVQLVVVSGTIIEITKVSSGVLQCESRGWYPEPEVLWLDGEGNLLSAGPTETVRGPDHLYTVSSRVTVEKRHSNSFTCRVQQRTINQTRETHITVPDDLFSGSSGSGSSSSASTIIGLVVGFMFILAVAFVLWKWRKNKNKKVEHHVDEETQRRGEKKSNSIINDSEQEFLIERESDNREKLTAERPMMKNQDKMKDKHHIDCLSEGTGRSCQNEKETHQEKAGGGTYQIVTHIKKDRTEVETGKDLDDTEEETPAPRPEQRDTHKEEPEDTYTDTAAQGREELKPAGQAPTDEKKDELEETGGQTGKSDATPCPTEGEGQHEKNTVEREMMKNSSRSEGTGCSYQNRKETHQEKAGGETNPIVTHIKKDRTEEETRLNLDDTDEETKSMNEETAAPRPEEKNSHQEEPEDTKPLNTETAVQGQMDSDGQQQLLGEEGGIKPAGQGLTGGENDELEETGGQKGESDATPCPTEGEGQHEKNTEKRDGALSLAEGRTDQLPEVLNGLNQKDDDGKTEPNKEPAGQNAIEEETQRNEIQPGGVIKPAGQGPTDGEKNELEQTLGKTGNSDATPEIDSAPSLADGQTYQLPKALNDVNKNNEDTKKESTNNEPAGQDARPRQTRRDELQTEGEKDTEEDNNVVTNDTEPLCSLKTETHTEQPEKSHDSRDGENGMKLINDDIRQTDKPPAGEKEVENAEEEKETEKTGLSCETARETNGDAQNRKEQGNRKSGREASD